MDDLKKAELEDKRERAGEAYERAGKDSELLKGGDSRRPFPSARVQESLGSSPISSR